MRHDPSDHSYRADSTPLVEFLEDQHPELRSVIPSDPSAAFLNFMQEDMSDEWVTKFMYQQRWHDPIDQEFYGRYLGWFRESPAPRVKVEEFANALRGWQVGMRAETFCWLILLDDMSGWNDGA
jgi:hypothetical protein